MQKYLIASFLLFSISVLGQQRVAPKQSLSAEFRRTADEALTAMDTANEVVLEPDSTFKPLEARANALASKLRRMARNAKEREVANAMDDYSMGIFHRRLESLYGKDPRYSEPDWGKARNTIIAALKK